MSSRVSTAVLLAAALLPGSRGRGASRRNELRVCADPNNLPFSNRAGKDLKTRLPKWPPSKLGKTLSYTWWAQRRGFIRHTLKAGRLRRGGRRARALRPR